MANVDVDAMKCVDETDTGINEWTSDDVYPLLVRGSIPTGINLEFTVTGPGSFWDEMDDLVVAADEVPISVEMHSQPGVGDRGMSCRI
ncbi:hypothetical protein [Nocardia sp. NPDC050710]|uniref:hypothetical protein n=1 Tax=Nocardia sp. NPDC050710 TaxID=3157220 RepID=UPI0033D0F52B